MPSSAKPINTRTNFKHVICPRYLKGKKKKKPDFFFPVLKKKKSVYPKLSKSKFKGMTQLEKKRQTDRQETILQLL